MLKSLLPFTEEPKRSEINRIDEQYRQIKEKLLLSEGTEHKIPYVDLFAKYEAEKKNTKVLKSMVDNDGETIRRQQDTIMDNNKIIRAYRDKVEQYEKDFNPFEFENEVLK